MGRITVVGGGLAGLVASIACAEGGAEVRLLEAQRRLGGRAHSTAAPFVANLGPHVVYDDGPAWTWLQGRALVGDEPRAPLTGIRFRYHGRLHRMPPVTALRAVTGLRRTAPVDDDFRSWATAQWGATTATVLANLAGVFSFDADPGRLSAAFVWQRLVRVFAITTPHARYVLGGWGALVERLADHARRLGVEIHTGERVTTLPEPPVIVATELSAAARLLGDDTLRTEGATVALLDVGLRTRRGDPFVVSDADASGWVERFSAPDPSLAPAGFSLLQAQVGLRPDETLDDGVRRIEELLDAGYRDWRSREVWRRRSVLRSMSGALDLPGTTWRDRAAVERGGGVFLAGDMVAAPGLLAEVAYVSALQAAHGALEAARVATGAAVA